MNDDELRAQLQRRAAAGRDDWVRRGLLPAVSSAIEGASAERVVGRGWSPVGALAAVAAVLAIVVGLAAVRPPTAPPPAASPSPRPATPRPLAVGVDCPLPAPAAPEEAWRQPPTVRDATGLIESCAVDRLVDGRPAAARVWVHPDAPRVLHVEWQGLRCEAAAALLLTGTHDDADLFIEYPENSGAWCVPGVVAHGVTLHLDRAVNPDDIDVRLETADDEQQGVDWAEVESEGAAFELRIFSPASTFVAGEPIEGISAELVYVGEDAEITLTGVGSLIQAFGVRQLDGPLAPGVGWDLPCVPETVRATLPYVEQFSKSGGFDDESPHAAWYREYFADPELRLPAGRWEVTAYSTFYVGNCGGPPVELKASVIIEVTPPPSAPTLSPTPPAEAISNTATTETSQGPFSLTIRADRALYRPGDPIAVEAELAYGGPAARVGLRGSGLFNGFDLEQLDGDLRLDSVHHLPCLGLSLARGRPERMAFQKSGAVDDHPPFDRAFFDDPELRLPAGRWKISVSSTFYLGDCGADAEEVSLRASVIVDVAGAPTATSSPSALNCWYPGGAPENEQLEPGWSVRVVDETGLIDGDCIFSGLLWMGADLAIETKPSSAGMGLHLTWPEDGCEPNVLIRFSRSADPARPFSLDVVESGNPPDACEEGRWSRQVYLSLDAAVAADEIVASLNGELAPTYPGFPPTAPGEAVRFECPRTPNASEAVVVIDRTGALISCAGRQLVDGVDGSSPTAANTDRELRGVAVEWFAGDSCDAHGAKLELWPRTNHGLIDRQWEPVPYLLLIRPARVASTEGCDQPQSVALRVELVLRVPVLASDIELARLGTESLDAQRLGDGTVALSLSAPAPAVFAARPVDLTAFLYWSGPGTTLHGDGQGLTTLTAEQLDGDLYFGPTAHGPEESCSGSWQTPSGDAPMPLPLRKVATMVPSGSDGLPYRDYLADPELRLPPGVWKLTAHTDVRVGSCDGPDAELSAVQVVEVLDAERPEAVPCAASNTISIVDGSGLVTSCSFGTTTADRYGVHVENPGGNPNELLVGWRRSTCDSPTEVELIGMQDGAYVAVVRTEGSEDCVGTREWRFVTLGISRPVDAARVTGYRAPLTSR